MNAIVDSTGRVANQTALRLCIAGMAGAQQLVPAKVRVLVQLTAAAGHLDTWSLEDWNAFSPGGADARIRGPFNTRSGCVR